MIKEIKVQLNDQQVEQINNQQSVIIYETEPGISVEITAQHSWYSATLYESERACSCDLNNTITGLWILQYRDHNDQMITYRIHVVDTPNRDLTLIASTISKQG